MILGLSLSFQMNRVPSQLELRLMIGRVVDAQFAIERGVSTAAVGVGVQGSGTAHLDERGEVGNQPRIVPIGQGQRISSRVGDSRSRYCVCDRVPDRRSLHAYARRWVAGS